MKNMLIAKRYANAAVQNLNPEKYQEVSHEASTLKKFFEDNPNYLRWLSSPIIHKEKKKEFFTALIENLKNKDFWASLFKVFIAKQRCDILDSFLTEFDYLLIENLQQTHINLILAHPQDEATIATIKTGIEKILKCKVTCDVSIDKDIIGGFVVMTRNQIIDASVRSQLQRFAKSITTRQ
jgi:F-type H+-transporting ATPase subunit delta